MSGVDHQRAGSERHQDPWYRRVLYALLLANVVGVAALVVQVGLRGDEEPTSFASGSGAVTAPGDDLDGSSGDAATPPSAPDAVLPSTAQGLEFLTPPEEFLPVGDARAGTGPLGLDEVT